MRTVSRTVAVWLAVCGCAAPAAAQHVDRQFDALLSSMWQLRQQVNGTARQAARQREALERQRQQAEQRRLAQEREIRSWPELTEPFSRTLRLGRNGTFELQNVAGNIVITGGGGDDVRIQATKRVRHRVEAQARAALPELRIDVMERGGNVEVRTRQPQRRAVVTEVEYIVTVPGRASVIVGTVSGNVRVTNIGGELRVESVGGNVTANAVRRVRALKSVSGNIDVSDGQADEFTATTMNGDVLVRNMKGRALDLNTIYGDVRLIDVELDRARLESMAGDLEYAGRFARSGRYEFQTHSGNIRVSPAGNPGFDLQASTFSGDVRSDYTLKRLQAADSRLPRARNRTLRGTFGDAGAVLTAESFSGDILIVRR